MQGVQACKGCMAYLGTDEDMAAARDKHHGQPVAGLQGTHTATGEAVPHLGSAVGGGGYQPLVAAHCNGTNKSRHRDAPRCEA